MPEGSTHVEAGSGRRELRKQAGLIVRVEILRVYDLAQLRMIPFIKGRNTELTVFSALKYVSLVETSILLARSRKHQTTIRLIK